ncbi:MAG: PIN domain-containing protein [Paludibacter sp.]|nr:PIN domain-containing protein [Paludibacter sp.]
MNVLFIDTNIYLRFFDENRKDLKKLLDTLLKVSNNIFITEQIVAEIERNKLQVFKQSISNYTNKLKIDSVVLPEHFATDFNNIEIGNWNKHRKALKNENEKLSKEIDEIIIKNLDLISKSYDSVSKGLEFLYLNAIKASNGEISNARLRRELGNPPGKQLDSLGDQVTWEQFLNKASTYNEVWIITNDSDYLTEYKGTIFLNSYLYSELRNRNSTLKINCFTDLLSGLESYGKKNNINDLIDKKTVKEIREEEMQYRIVLESSNLKSVKYDSNQHILEIEFLNESLYQYFDVPENVFENLLSSSSPGRFFENEIKGTYRYSKV